MRCPGSTSSCRTSATSWRSDAIFSGSCSRTRMRIISGRCSIFGRGFRARSSHPHFLGLVLTHAHDYHFGALLDLWPRLAIPVYATPFTAALIEAKREGEPGSPEIPVNVVPLDGRFTLGPFDVEFVSMAHSIPESNGLIIRTPAGAVLHTGDWKIDPTPVIGAPTDEAKLGALGNEGCLALIGDSTNAFREGRSPSEADVAKCLAELIRSAPARVAVTTFASNVARMRAIAQAAASCEREIVLIGRAMERIAQVARETGYLDG